MTVGSGSEWDYEKHQKVTAVNLKGFILMFQTELSVLVWAEHTRTRYV